ncbi:hypothetical protein ScPMuIL_013339 [Solemya velum]
MDSNISKKTQDTLGKIIKKPPLTDKLLSKPPFRFLHDVMTSVIKTTGFMKGLYTDAEMNSENVKDKDSKLAFLQKSLDIVCLVTGKTPSVKLNKVIAGHEPEKTNEFLQLLAVAINMKVDNADVVKKVLNKGKETKTDEDRKERSKSGDRRKREEKRERSKDREEGVEKGERHQKEDRRDREKDERRDRERSREGRDREERHRSKEDRHKDRDKDRQSSKKNSSDTSEGFSSLEDLEFDPSTANQSTPKAVSNSSEKGARKEIQNQKQTAKVAVVPNSRQSVRKSPHAPSKVQKSPPTSRQVHVDRSPRPPEKKSPLSTSSRPQKTPLSTSSSPRSQMVKTQKVDQPAAETKSTQETPKSSKILDKKRKLGTKSRLSVRTTESSTETQNKKKDEVAEVKPENRDRRNSRDQRLQGRGVKPVRTREEPQKRSKGQSDSQCKPGDKHRTSSFAILGVLGDDSRDEGKENESPKLVNGEAHQAEEEIPPAARIPRPTSAKGHRRRREEDDMVMQRTIVPKQAEALHEDDLPPQVVDARKLPRPSSARPAPPRRKQEGMESEPAMRLGSGKPTNVIVDDGKSSEDEDENFLVEESAPPIQDVEQASLRPEVEDETDHGGLVKAILETKKELEGGSQRPQAPKTQIERPHISDAQRRKQREHVQREIDKLRASIQTLTRSANPLGKIMDYVQEDLDSMQKEHEKWKEENKEHALALKREKMITDRAVEPMKAQLAEIDQAIKDQLDLIAAVKSNIIKNDQRIDKMLRSIAKS